jgi:translation elongation factor EF-G
LAEQRDHVIDTILRHHPQPLNIQPLNTIVPDEVNSNSEKASETTPEAAASDKVVSEDPQQQ